MRAEGPTYTSLDDLAQEVFLRLYRALPGFRGEAMLSSYLYRITVNVAQDEWKRRRRQDEPLTSLTTAPAMSLPWKTSWRIRRVQPSSGCSIGSFGNWCSRSL